MSLVSFLFGKPLPSDDDKREKVGPAAGVPIFGLDALGSAAYGPEAALTILIPAGLAGLHVILPITAAISGLLAIVYFSYRQTIEAYPSGGGSYLVARKNLGDFPGLLAASALLVDYVLVVAVGISAGVAQLVSALPGLKHLTLPLCLAALAIIAVVNLRGVRQTGAVFLVPTYLFVVCLGGSLAYGVIKALGAGGHPVPVLPPPRPAAAGEAVSLWLLLRAFSSGCTAMTGVEAVSNGTMAFREPRSRNARITLTIIIGILILLLLGIAVLCRAYHIGATDPNPGGPHYESVLSQLLQAIGGRGVPYAVTMASILIILVLQANTAFADFPRLCHFIAQDGFLPSSFANRGRRLVYSHGIYVLVFLAAVLLLAFGGVTDRLIPLFAIGAFLAFTLSQAGMVGHWRRTGGAHARHSVLINGVGAIATGITTLVVLVSKFRSGAWVVVLIVPAIILTMRRIRGHYRRMERELEIARPMATGDLRDPLVVVPIDEWNRVTERALRLAVTIGREIVAVHIESQEDEGNLAAKWHDRVEGPLAKAGLPQPALVVLKSPYRYVIGPILDYVLELERRHPDRQIAVLVPNLVERRWYRRFLHNQRGELLSALLLLKGDQRIVIINVPWYVGRLRRSDDGKQRQ